MALDSQTLAHACVRVGQGGRRIATPGLERRRDVASDRLVKHRSVALDGAARIGNGRQRMVVDSHDVQRVFGEVTARGDDEGHRLTHVPDLVASERRLQARDDARPWPQAYRDAADGAEVIGGDDGHDTGKRERGSRVNGTQAGMSMRRAQDGSVEHPRQAKVGGVRSPAHQEPAVFETPHGTPDRGHDFTWKSRAALPPRIAASAVFERPASRTILSGSGSPSQNG